MASSEMGKPGSVDDLFNLIMFLSDPKKMGTKLKEMEKARAEMNETVALVGKANEIRALRVQAESDRNGAKDILAAAREAAKKILSDADDRSARDQEELKVGLGGMRSKISKLSADRTKMEKTAFDRENTAESQMKEAMKLHREATDLMQVANDTKDQFETKLKNLKKSIAGA